MCSSYSEAIWGKNCSQYTGYEYNIAELTGLNFENDGLADYYTNDCISCRESELKYKDIVEYGDHLSVYDLQVESGYHWQDFLTMENYIKVIKFLGTIWTKIQITLCPIS